MKKRYLLDSHTVIWFFEGNQLLPTKIRNIIVDSENEVYTSIVTLWEIAIKISIGKLVLSNPLAEILNKLISNNINIIQIDTLSILHLLNMPFYHKDPFDRLIIAQSYTENLILLSNEVLFDNYNVNRIW